MLVEQIIVLMKQAMMLMEKIIAPAAISISWMSGADDSVADQSVAKFPLPARPCLCLGRREHIHEPQHPGTHEPIASSRDGEDVHYINIKVIVFALRNERRRAIK